MSQRACQACAASLDLDAAFCPRCGAAQSGAPAGCAGCGAALEPDARFCPKCGASVAADAQPARSPAAPGRAPAPSEPPARAWSGGATLLVVLVVGALGLGAWAFLAQRSPGSGTLPSLETATPPRPSPAVTPTARGTLPAGADPAPTGGGMPPHGGAMPPHGGGMPPHGGAMPPQGGGMPPQGGGMPPQGGAMPPHGGGMPPSATAGGPAAGPIAGTIELAAALASKVKPGSVLYLMARPTDASNQSPIAVARIELATFPIPFSLGADNLMGGAWGAPVNLSVRLDADGDAMSKEAGDLYGESPANPVATGTQGVRVLIDQVL